MKAYTDLEQSKNLARILPIESADMYYPYFGDNKWGETARFGEAIEYSGKKDIPCWSLAALLNAIPQIKIRGSKKIGYIVSYNKNIASNRSFNIVDACYEMLLKLHEQKLL